MVRVELVMTKRVRWPIPADESHWNSSSMTDCLGLEVLNIAIR
jgi:hypothetical protein